MNRWTKLANIKPIFDIGDNVLDRFSKPGNESKLILDVRDHFLRCADKAGQCKENLLIVMNGAVNIEKQLAKYERGSKQTKIDDLQTFIGPNIPKEVETLPP